MSGKDGAQEIKDLVPPQASFRVAKLLRRNPNPFFDVLAVFQLLHIFRKENPDIIFLNSSKAGFVGSIAALLMIGRRHVRVIYRIGGWTFHDPRPWWLNGLYFLLEKLSAHWKDYIVVNNKYDLEAGQRLKIKPRRELVLIHNGIDPYLNFFERDRARSELVSRLPRSIDTGRKPWIGVIANFYPAKGLIHLIRAATQLEKDTLTLIIGDGKLRRLLEQEIRQNGLREKVFLLGKIPNAHRYLPAFDVFALPSIKEGLPWVILEAMAAKVPVVTTRVGAIPELIENNTHGLVVDPGAPAQLARAIDRLLNDERLGQDLALQAHQRLVKDFSLLAMVRRYEELFRI